MQAAGIQCTILQAFDVNENANLTYAANFAHAPCTTSIEHLQVGDLDKYKQANVWVMSPPCQPYTLNGSEKDLQDERAASFVHLLKLLPQVQCKPSYLLLENVKNFECSKARDLLVQTCAALGYVMEEYLLCPTQLGIPNERIRYYFLARKAETSSITPLQTKLFESCECKPLSAYLLAQVPASLQIPDAALLKQKGYRFDLVHAASTRSACFTKSYGQTKFMRGTGSLVQTCNLEQVSIATNVVTFIDDRL